MSLSELLREDEELDLPIRVARIRHSIDTFPVQDVQEVLDFCEKMICDDNIDTAKLGYTILVKIASRSECTSMHRVMFYNKIIFEDKPEHFSSHRSYLFSFLTEGGRNIEGFTHLLPTLIARLYNESTIFNTANDYYAKQAFELGVKMQDSLDVLCTLIKFNSTFVSDEDIAGLIQQMLEERNETAPVKYQKCISVIDTLIMYTYIPPESVYALAKVLSFWVGKSYIVRKASNVDQERTSNQERTVSQEQTSGLDQSDIQEQTSEQYQTDNQEKCLETLRWLLTTHLKDRIFDDLLSSLNDDSIHYQQARGAGILICHALINVQTRKLVNFDLPILLGALIQPMPGDQLGNACVRLSIINEILKDEEMQGVFLAETDWTLFQQAINYNVTRPDCGPFNVDNAIDDPESCPDGDRLLLRMHLFRNIIEQLEGLTNMSLMQSRTLRKIALSAALLLDTRQAKKLIEAYDPSAFRISVGNWLPEIKEIAQVYINNVEADMLSRQQALNVVNGALQKAQELGEPEAVRICGSIIMDALGEETNPIFRNNLTHCVITFVSNHFVGSDEGFQTVVDVLLRSARTVCHTRHTLHAMKCHDLVEGGKGSEDIKARFISNTDLPSMLPDAGLVVLLMRSSMTHPKRACMLYKEILNLVVYRETDRDPEATVMLLRGLFRIRADIEHHIFFVASPEGESLAASLNRNAHNPRLSLRRGSNWGEEERPPVWRYNEIVGLPEDPPSTISPALRSDLVDSTISKIHDYLDMTEWLRIVTNIIDTGADWEVYSYIIVHLGAQLSNQSLFTNCVPQIKALASCICSKIQQQTVMKPPELSNLRQGDVALCLIDILTTIIGYHWRFQRAETENMISAFIMGLTAWDITTVPCVHALTLCCYELPISLSRDLVRIVEKMSTIVTKSDAAIHVLEFLAGMSRLEGLTSRFHGDEIKTVFGVCFSYIEYARGKRYDEAQQRAMTRSLNPTRQGSVASGQRPSTDDIPQYVFAISYHVITFWFLTLRSEDCKKYLPWMEQRLLSRDQAGNVEDEAVVTLDHLWRIAEGRSANHSSPVIVTSATSSSPDEPQSQTWISEYCMLTILCRKAEGSNDGAIEVVERRCSGTDFRQLAAPSPNATPEDVFAHYNLSSAMNGPFKSTYPPALLAITDSTRRSLAIFDRTSPIDFFKCGLIYIGEKQTEQVEILSNVSGSPDYNSLIAGLGKSISLANHRGNVAGLDTSEGVFDGSTTYQHSDGVTTLNYHITTMMPTNREHDPQCTRKKSHIGNDYVNIIFNNSGLVSKFDFNTFPSAFNYVYIVVTPEARQTFIQTRTRSLKANWYEDSWFRVQVMTREDFPDISSAAETKVVSGMALSEYVRNLALNAEVFCRVWTNRGSGEYPSSWRSRLGQIRQLRERVEKMEKEREG